MQLYTIGHSTRSLEDFMKILKYYKIELLVDIRHFPHSKHNSQFNKELLEKELPKNGIEYSWIEKLGGFRSGGYKKYAKTKEFADGLNELTSKAEKKIAAIMCAELLWFKCHRRFVADELKRRKIKVMHIYDENQADKHKITMKRKIKCD